MSYSDEFKAGWAAARECYQLTGGVPPHPPQQAPVPEPPVETPIGGEEAVPAPKRASRKKSGGAA